MDNKHRRSIRFAGYDYAQGGAYFVTICTNERKCVFGRIENGAMRLNAYGEIVRDCWLTTSELRPGVDLDEWMIMPNHFHAIVIIGDRDVNVGAQRAAPLQISQIPHVAAGSLGAIVRAFKSAATRATNAYRMENNLVAPVKVWQRNYFERIIRDEKELNDTRRYIIENPLNWASDENNIN